MYGCASQANLEPLAPDPEQVLSLVIGVLSGTALNVPLLNGKVNAGFFWRLKTPRGR